MSYSDILKPRAEVLSEEGIEGIIDLKNLDDPKGKKLEANPKRFFSLTYPTADIKRVVQNLADRFSGSKDTPGLFLFEGLKGSGKSHLLLLIYHLFKSFKTAQEWLDTHKMYCNLPQDTVVVINKFTDLPLYSIWDFIFEQLTGKTPKKSVVQPSLEEVEKVLADKRLILILDELEQGIRVIADPAIKAQNIAFLQMLSEWANRSDKVTVFASIYSQQEEPGSTLKRVPSCRVQFAHSPDRAKIVLYRLFENYLDFKTNACRPIIESYLNLWRREKISTLEEYNSQMLVTYPFLPEVLELILERVPARGGFQSVRGALGFLANLVRLTNNKVDLITAAHSDIEDREVFARLSDLDPSGDLISKARSNLKELKTQPLASEIAATVMLYTLTNSGRNRGANREELIKHIINPRVDINDFEKTLLAFQKYASHFWLLEGRYYFDLEENPDAKVEYRALTIDPDGSKARNLLHNLWRDEIFREPNSIIYQGEEESKNLLESLDKNRIRVVLSPKRLSQLERHNLFFGLANRNQVILLEPKDAKFNLDTHKDLIKWAQRQLAAQELSASSRDSGRRAEYDRIYREDKIHCIDTIKRAGLVYIRWEKYGEKADSDLVEEEAVNGCSKEDLLNLLSQQLFPTQYFAEHLLSRSKEILNRSAGEIDKEYRSILGFPVPATQRSVSQALRELCREKKIGIHHPRGHFCGEDPNLSETELFESVISEPFESGAPTPPVFAPLPPGAATPAPIPGTLIPTPAGETQELRIPPQESIGSLRQAAAVRLQEFPEAKITQIQANIFLQQEAGDLAALPAALRGNLSGAGSITAEITLTKSGEFTKGEAERIIESLPNFPNAYYGLKLQLLLPVGVKGKENE